MFKYGLTYIASVLLNAKNQSDIDVFKFLSCTYDNHREALKIELREYYRYCIDGLYEVLKKHKIELDSEIPNITH